MNHVNPGKLMEFVKWKVLGTAIGLLLNGTALAWPGIERGTLTVCPAAVSGEQVPTFTEFGCDAVPMAELDPQGRDLWLRGIVRVPADVDLAEPRALLLSGKFSASVWLNGTHIGNKGEPGPDRQSEQPGKMDIGLPIPHGVLVSGENSLVLRMSSHHNLLRLDMPIHGLAFADTEVPANAILRHYWTTLLPFGALLLAGVYLLALVVLHRRGDDPLEQDGGGTLALCMMALFAAVQLFVEVARGTLGYAYPWHDVRLLLIVACAGGFGLSLLAHVLARVAPGHRDRLVGGAAAAVVLAWAVAPGYDLKAAFAILVPLGIGLLVSLAGIRSRQPLAGRYALVLALFCAIITLAPSVFLDRYFFYVVSALLLFLVIQQAKTFSRHRSELQHQLARADRLQLIVERQAQKRDPGYLEARSVGSVQRIAIADIAFCKGAGDYVELHLADGREILHQDTLADLEARLPAIFLRVHRSYLVNTDRIDSLTRLPNGSGELILTTAQQVPVSRRIMPTVRRGLAENEPL